MIEMDYFSFPLLVSNKASLRDCSFDSANNLYLSQSNTVVVNFDDVKTQYYANLKMTNEKACSVDAIAKNKDASFCMVEFKSRLNGENPKVNLKVRDSLLILCSICNTTIDETRKNIDFIVVFDETRTTFSTKDKVAIAMANQSGTISSYGGFDKLEGSCFRKCVLCSSTDFNKRFVPFFQSV